MIIHKFFNRAAATVVVTGMIFAIAADLETTAQTPWNLNQRRDPRRQLLENDYGLRVLDSCPPARRSLAVVYFPEAEQTYTYCATPNRFVQAGQYTYDPRTDRLNPGAPTAQTPPTQTTDSRRQLLQNEYGLTVLEDCPAVTTSLVVAYFPEYGQNYTYCANPTRFIRAGEYTYDLRTGELNPGAPTAQTPSSPNAPSQTTDFRQQRLERDFGLTVLDDCPASTSSLVVVSYPEGDRTYRYCANPNRVFPAGEYTYNPRTRRLETAEAAQPCTVEIGGVCVIR